uniref:ARAD1D27610p n=1 Tax=Blastobotrys adeninivorans TaxID=409370 RepID=A0A060TG27_BLAAD
MVTTENQPKMLVKGAAEETNKDKGTSKRTECCQSGGNGAVIADNAAESIIAPFLSRHVSQNVDQRYCYRHHPEIMCNRQADSRRMNELQSQMEQEKEPDRQAINHVWSVFSAATPNQRLLLLKGILAQCCYPQLSALSSMMEDMIRIDFISALPPELAFKVLCYLDTASLCRAAQVSRRWRELADDDVVWHRMCEQHIDRKCTKCGWGLPLLEKRRLRDSKRAIEARAACFAGRKRDASEMESGEQTNNGPQAKTRKTRPWKEVYSERYQVEGNWRRGRYKLRTFEDGDNADNSVLCLQFDEQYLIAGTQKGMVNVWDIESGQIVRRLQGHVRAVNGLKFDASKLVTASSDHTVRIWNYHTGECISTFQGHEDKVRCIDLSGCLVASGSDDHCIKVWNFEDKSFFTLRGHTDAVHDVKIHLKSRTLFSASEDMTVRMWSLDTKKCLKVFGDPGSGIPGGHVAQVQCVLPLTLDHLEGADDYHHHGSGEHGGVSETEGEDDDKQQQQQQQPSKKQRPTHLLSASLDNTIKLWDIRTGQCVRTLFGHIEGVWTIAADTFRIVSGSHDRTVKVWDLQSGRCWHTFSGHQQPVCCVGLSDTRFASGGDDGIVRMYCYD